MLVNENKNPLFFVSGSSFNLYDLLTKFCQHHNIPKAPFLLRNLGLDNEKWFKLNTDKYKKAYIEEILQMYPDLSFILIGDSGQKDPEIYTSLCEKYPNQIKAIYIRHVGDQARLDEINALGQQISADFLVMNHSKEAIKHLKNKNWGVDSILK
ncbi:App1 family protein [Fulvivirga maritima]|uniref:phosphatase domain-containing protein n=1 Tax=Fulvivirga maritima TaxID=2904247 RepID=UPI001F1D3166|nr:App1 family protein [Fulvivirga maritima]UII26980.1 App1 family protein [Fulvivirga maritima]